jgi:hypothetical protein
MLERVLPASELLNSTSFFTVKEAHSWRTPWRFMDEPGLTLITGSAGSGKSLIVDALRPYALATFVHREPTRRHANGDYPSFSPSAVLLFLLQALAHRVGIPMTPYTPSEQQMMMRPLLVVDSMSAYLTEDTGGAGSLAATGASNAVLNGIAGLNNLATYFGIGLVYVMNPDNTPSVTTRAELISAAGRAKANTLIEVQGVYHDARTEELTVRTQVYSRHNDTREAENVTFTIHKPNYIQRPPEIP